LHAAAIAAVATGRRHARPPRGADPVEAEIALESLEDSNDLAQTSRSESAGAPRIEHDTRGGHALAKLAPRDSAKGDPLETSPDETAPSRRTNDRWSFSPTAVHVDIERALEKDYLAPATTHRDTTPNAEERTSGSTTGGVAEGLATRDAEAGLGRGGGVVSAAEGAARGEAAPLRGGATFEVIVRADGSVGAQVVAATGDVDAWQEVARDLARRVDPKKIRIPPGARGWRVVVSVDAKVVYADGRDTTTMHGVRASVEPSVLSSALSGERDARGSSTGAGGPDHVAEGVTDAPPLAGALGPEKPRNVGGTVITGLVARILPTPTLSVEGKVCSAKVSLTPLGIGIGGTCSLENIGNGTSRRVSGRVVTEGQL
jgi:hypothetical protein